MKRKDKVKELIRQIELLQVIEGMMEEFEKDGLWKKMGKRHHENIPNFKGKKVGASDHFVPI